MQVGRWRFDHLGEEPAGHPSSESPCTVPQGRTFSSCAAAAFPLSPALYLGIQRHVDPAHSESLLEELSLRLLSLLLSFSSLLLSITCLCYGHVLKQHDLSCMLGASQNSGGSCTHNILIAVPFVFNCRILVLTFFLAERLPAFCLSFLRCSSHYLLSTSSFTGWGSVQKLSANIRPELDAVLYHPLHAVVL